MPELTHDQWERVQDGEVVVIESNIDNHNEAGQDDPLNVNFSPSKAQIDELREEGRILYEIDAEVHNSAGQDTGPTHIAVRRPGY